MESYLDYIQEDTDISIINEFTNGIVLYPKQIEAVKASILNKSGIWTVEMGLGKTILTVGVATILTPIINAGGFIVISAGTNTIKSFEKYIRENTTLKPVYTTGEADKVANCIKMIESGQANCVLCTHSTWVQSLDFNMFIYNNLDRVKGMIYDECEGTENNLGYCNFIEFAHNVDYVYPANATPVNSGSFPIYSLLYAVKATDMTYKQFRRQYCFSQQIGENKVENINVEKIKKDFDKYLINFNRKDVNADTHYETPRFRSVGLTPLQQEAYSDKTSDKASILYGLSSAAPTPTANPAFLQLIQTITCKPPTDSKVVFCWHQQSSEMITQVFRGMGMTVMQLNGYKTPTSEEKDYIEKEFNATPGAILVTSSYKGNNLNSANHIIVYETPPDIGQYIARVARGYDSKTIFLDWIYYPALEQESLYKALISCIDNAVLTERDFTLANIIFDEILDKYPLDPRNTDLAKRLNR